MLAAGPRRPPAGPHYTRPVDGIELFFTGLLVLVSIFIAWFAGYVVYKLYKGQA